MLANEVMQGDAPVREHFFNAKSALLPLAAGHYLGTKCH
jgi:hypothetical protein